MARARTSLKMISRRAARWGFGAGAQQLCLSPPQTLLTQRCWSIVHCCRAGIWTSAFEEGKSTCLTWPCLAVTSPGSPARAGCFSILCFYCVLLVRVGRKFAFGSASQLEAFHACCALSKGERWLWKGPSRSGRRFCWTSLLLISNSACSVGCLLQHVSRV